MTEIQKCPWCGRSTFACGAECRGEQPCAGELAYQVERKRARRWKRRAVRAEATHAWELVAQGGLEVAKMQAELDAARTEWDSIDRERTELRADLDALRVRARGMWQCLTKAAIGATSIRQFEFARLLTAAAGEPIP